VTQLQSSFFKYWVLTSKSDEEGGVHQARPLGYPPNWPIQRGWRGFDFREDGKFSYFTFTASDKRIELHGSW
jgi:hypothetical protein